MAFLNFANSLKESKYMYRVHFYDVNKKHEIINEDFILDNPYNDIFVFVHPIMVMGFLTKEGTKSIVHFKVI